MGIIIDSIYSRISGSPNAEIIMALLFILTMLLPGLAIGALIVRYDPTARLKRLGGYGLDALAQQLADRPAARLDAGPPPHAQP
jgi:hypothetical protein